MIFHITIFIYYVCGAGVIVAGRVLQVRISLLFQGSRENGKWDQKTKT